MVLSFLNEIGCSVKLKLNGIGMVSEVNLELLYFLLKDTREDIVDLQ